MKSLSRKIISAVSATVISFSSIAFLPSKSFENICNLQVSAAEKTISIKKCTIKLKTNTFIYNGKAIKPSTSVYYRSKKLVCGKDYTLKYTNNKKVGNARVTVLGKGKYSGSLSKIYKIQATQTCKNLKAKTSSNKITLSWSKAKGTSGYILQKYTSGKFATIYKGKKQTFSDKNIQTGKKYTYRVGSYKKIKNTTYYYYSAPIKVNAYNLISLDKCNVTLSSNSRIYNGNPQQPAVTVTYGGQKLTQGKDYKLKYSNQIYPGTACVTISGSGKFSGILQQYYSIVPFGEIKTPTASCTANSISLKWNPVANAQGYEIQQFDRNINNFVTVATSYNTNYTFENLSPETTYKFRILAFIKIGENTHYGYSHFIEKTTLPNNETNSEMTQQVLELVNQQRAANGLNPLTFDAELNNCALLRAKEVAANVSARNDNELTENDHYYADRNTYDKIAAFYILENKNFDWFKNSSDYNLGENLAKGQKTAEKVVNDWMNSPRHRENILGNNYNRIGIACYTENNTTYWVQVFAT